MCLETAGDAAGTGSAGWGEQDGGDRQRHVGDRGGEAGACHARGRTWLLPAMTLQVLNSGLWSGSLFGELKFQLL